MKLTAYGWILLLIAGCSARTESALTYITEQEAIRAAVEIAAASRPEISGSQEQPSNIQAKQMTLEEAVKTIGKDDQPAAGYDPHMIVWLITMDGLWLSEVEAPGITVTPAFYHHYAIMLDAKTGAEVESALTT